MTSDLISLELHLMVLTLNLNSPNSIKVLQSRSTLISVSRSRSPTVTPCSPLGGPPRSPHTPPVLYLCPCLNISHCCCRWCVMQDWALIVYMRVGAAVCGPLACGATGHACGRWRQSARLCPPVCLSTPLFGHTWPRLESPTWPLGFYLFLVSFVLRSYIDSFDLCPCFSPCSLVCSLYFTVSLFHSFFLSCLEW